MYSEGEKEIILHFIEANMMEGSSSGKILKKAEELETNANQLLEFTKIIKDSSKEIKNEIIEKLWKILISDKKVDQYESNLMRRICGLIYFSD